MSDRFSGGDVPPLEIGVKDVVAVVQAIGADRVCLWGHYDGALVASLFAATYPDKVRALMLHCPSPYEKLAPDWPWGWDDDEWAANIEGVATSWGTQAHTRQILEWACPSLTPTDDRVAALTRYFRLAGSPPAMAALQRVLRDSDIRQILPTIRVPTLVTYRGLPEVYAVEESRQVAEMIPDPARFVELDGPDFAIWADPAPICAEVEEFLLGSRTSAGADRVLSTLLFTDIVDSTSQLARLGDAEWATLLAQGTRAARSG